MIYVGADMNKKKRRAYLNYTQEAAILLGKSIQLGRKARKFSTYDFADRAGISRNTLKKIESGNLKCELGIVLEAAALAGVKLFDAEPASVRNPFAENLEHLNDKLALLPKRIHEEHRVVDDAF